MNAKNLVLAVAALAATVAAASVQARGVDDVRLSINIGGPSWVQPMPAYRYAPAPVFVAPRYYRPAGPVYRAFPTRWDRDGDGIPNRYDRVYNPRWDRDGDGIPNRYDRRDDLRSRHDGRGPGRW